jgi:hypothetical protein
VKAPNDELLPRKEIQKIWNSAEHLKAFLLDELKRLDQQEYDLAIESEDPNKLFELDELERINEYAIARDLQLRMMRGQIINAARKKDDVTIRRLIAKHPELAAYAYQKRTRRHIQGREKGDPRPWDQSPELRERLAYADRDVGRIYDILRRKLDKSYCREAIEIAAERWAVTVKQLINFRKR